MILEALIIIHMCVCVFTVYGVQKNASSTGFITTTGEHLYI